MNPQLQSALDALNACPDAAAVADLLRRHGIRASTHREKGSRCTVCPLAVYLRKVGGTRRVRVDGWGNAEFSISEQVRLNLACRDFIAAVDANKYPDLEATA